MHRVWVVAEATGTWKCRREYEIAGEKKPIRSKSPAGHWRVFLKSGSGGVKRAGVPRVKYMPCVFLESHLLFTFQRDHRRGESGAGVASEWEGLAVTSAEQKDPIHTGAAPPPSLLADGGVAAGRDFGLKLRLGLCMLPVCHPH